MYIYVAYYVVYYVVHYTIYLYVRSYVYHIANKVNMIYYIFVVVCTNLSGKEPHRQIGQDSVIESGNLAGLMVRVL